MIITMIMTFLIMMFLLEETYAVLMVDTSPFVSNTSIEEFASGSLHYKKLLTLKEITTYYNIVNDFLMKRTNSLFPKIIINDFKFIRKDEEHSKVYHFGNYDIKAWKNIFNSISKADKDICIFIDSPERDRLAPQSKEDIGDVFGQFDSFYSVPMKLSAARLQINLMESFDEIWAQLKQCVFDNLTWLTIVKLQSLALKTVKCDTIEQRIANGIYINLLNNVLFTDCFF